MDLKNYFCPVCSNDFNEDDDVVFCPECGTPHHRSCWAEKGKCINENLHGTEENVSLTYTRAEPAKEQLKKEQATEIKAEPTVENADNPLISRNIEIDANTAINGRPGYLYEIAVRKNQKYYIPRFILEDKDIKAPSWNFIAFLVPLAWTLYRKMYKFSAIILAIYLAIIGVTGYFVMSNEEYVKASAACMEEDPQFITKISMYEAGEDVVLTQNQQKLIEAMNSIEIPGYVTTGSTIILYVIRFFMGICGNKQYFKKISKSIDKGVGRGLDGDKLKMFVYRKNGVLPIVFAVLVGIAEWFMV